jgi:5'-deoxynucleotidase YfbR-like HD superfamily hydrolase
MPPDLKARVKASAEQNNRSMNAEIVATLEERYPAPLPDEEISELVERLLALVPSDVIEKFIVTTLEKNGVTDQDIRDGLIPGVSLAPAPDDD